MALAALAPAGCGQTLEARRADLSGPASSPPLPDPAPPPSQAPVAPALIPVPPAAARANDPHGAGAAPVPPGPGSDDRAEPKKPAPGGAAAASVQPTQLRKGTLGPVPEKPSSQAAAVSATPDGDKADRPRPPSVMPDSPGAKRPGTPSAAGPVPRKPEEPVVTALRAFLRNRPGEALDALQGYEKPGQDMMLVVLPFLARLTEESIDQVSPREAADLVDRLRRLEAMLQPRAALQMDRIAYCRKVAGFGKVEAVDPGQPFEGGRDGKPGELVQVYAELSNFSSRLVAGQHETWLAGRVEVRDGDRRVVWFENFPLWADRSHSPKRDFFVNYYFCVPPSLPPGRYSLWVQVKDVTGVAKGEPGVLTPASMDVPDHRVAVGSLDFTVKGPSSLADSGRQPGSSTGPQHAAAQASGHGADRPR